MPRTLRAVVPPPVISGQNITPTGPEANNTHPTAFAEVLSFIRLYPDTKSTYHEMCLVAASAIRDSLKVLEKEMSVPFRFKRHICDYNNPSMPDLYGTLAPPFIFINSLGKAEHSPLDSLRCHINSATNRNYCWSLLCSRNLKQIATSFLTFSLATAFSLVAGVSAIALDVTSTIPRASEQDWLVNPAPYHAQITEEMEPRRLILENGLARRVILLGANAATIDLHNLISGEHYLRAIAPEARVKIDGSDYEIGGLQGAPLANYISPAWQGQLGSNPASYRFVSYEIGATIPRFTWTKRPEWMARDLPWPPPGKHVVMRYAPPVVMPAGQLSGQVVSQIDFSNMPMGTKLDSTWKELKSDGFDRASFSNEGKAGEVVAMHQGSACIECPWPSLARSVEVFMDSGNDMSTSWGPGMALVTETRTFRFILRPGDGQYEVDGKAAGSFDPSKPCYLRVRLIDDIAVCEASQDKETYVRVGIIPSVKNLKSLRMGKVGIDGSGTSKGKADSKDADLLRSHIFKATWRGDEAPQDQRQSALPDVEVHYELYDGIPLMQKWLVIKNDTSGPIHLNHFVAEELRVTENNGYGGKTASFERPNLYLETDYAFGGSMDPHQSNVAVSLGSDKDYPTQVDYSLKSRCVFTCQPSDMGPGVDIKTGEHFTSFRVFILLQDSSERERRTLMQRRMYRTIAPWTAQNPFMFHKLGSDSKSVRAAIDQAAMVGFDMVIMSFGSKLNMENQDPTYLRTYRELVDYGKTKGISLGGYSLLASRKVNPPQDNTQGSPAAFGWMPCLGSTWGQRYLASIRNFCEQTGFEVFENDGPYPGDLCDACNHPGHRGLEDSQWTQWRAMTSLYQWCAGKGIFLNVPDWYFLSGGNKCGMGYRETNWSLPREQQIIIERQNMYDGTWDKTASMGWMFLPLSQYHGGGAAATIEPLDEHRDHYNERFADLVGFGVQACFRGPRLFDTEATASIVKTWTSFYKKHREVLDGDIIHLRRATGVDWDGILHVNPQGKEKAMAFLYNPLEEDITPEIRIPLYYSALRGATTMSIGGEALTRVAIDETCSISIRVKIPAHSHQWIIFTQ